MKPADAPERVQGNVLRAQRDHRLGQARGGSRPVRQQRTSHAVRAPRQCTDDERYRRDANQISLDGERDAQTRHRGFVHT